MSSANNRIFGDEYVCPVCKKVFVCVNQKQWAYKVHTMRTMTLCCSWTCINIFKARRKTWRREQREKKDIERYGMKEICKNCKYSHPSYKRIVCDIKDKRGKSGETCEKWEKKGETA